MFSNKSKSIKLKISSVENRKLEKHKENHENFTPNAILDMDISVILTKLHEQKLGACGQHFSV
jgi:hypothetical protein